MDPDRMTHYELPHLDVQSVQIHLFSCLALKVFMLHNAPDKRGY